MAHINVVILVRIGFSYKPYTEDLLQTYFHSGIDTAVVWRLVEAIQQK